MVEEVRGVAALISWLRTQWRDAPRSPGDAARLAQSPSTVVMQELPD